MPTKQKPIDIESLPRETLQLMRRDIASQIVSLLRRKASLNQEVISQARTGPRLHSELERINRELKEAEHLERRMAKAILRREKSAG